MHAAKRYRLLNNVTIVISIIGVAIALLDSGFTLPMWLQQVFHIFSGDYFFRLCCDSRVTSIAKSR